MSERNKVLVALCVSLLLHVIGILGLMTWASLRSSAARPAPQADLRQIVMTVAPLPKPPAPVPAVKATPPPKPMEINSDGLAKADKPPEHPMFESDIDSHAASQLPPSGLAPLPSQEGKQRPFPQYETKQSSLGPIQQQPPEMEMPPASAPQKAAESDKNPQEKAEKETPKKVIAESTPKPAVPKPTATPIPASSPKESQDTIAVAASPTPEPSATPTPAASPNEEIPKPTPYQPVMHRPKVQDLAMLAKPAPRQPRPRRPTYQPQTEETRVEGSISNMGTKPGADVVSTPLGRYRKTIGEAIGQRWYFYVNQNLDLIPVGSVHIKFYINELGRVEDIKILSNSSSGAFGDFSVQSISEADLPPLPPDLAPKLENGRLEVEYTFTIYPN